jgi:hypothetical protein
MRGGLFKEQEANVVESTHYGIHCPSIDLRNSPIRRQIHIHPPFHPHLQPSPHSQQPHCLPYAPRHPSPSLPNQRAPIQVQRPLIQALCPYPTIHYFLPHTSRIYILRRPSNDLADFHCAAKVFRNSVLARMQLFQALNLLEIRSVFEFRDYALR